MKRYIPSLVQVGDNAIPSDETNYVCDLESGLLHRPGDPVPAIERLLQENSNTSASLDCLQTVMTKADTDPLDPDVIRSGTVSRIADLQTDLQKVAPDPDVIRAEWRQRFPTE